MATQQHMLLFYFFDNKKVYYNYTVPNHGGSVIPAAVKTLDNKFARIIKPGRNMPAVKTPGKKFA